MELYFKTELNRNGNQKRLVVDLNAREMRTDFSCPLSGDYIVISRDDMSKLKELFREDLYKEV